MRGHEAERGWWQRNWGWCVGCGCLLPLLALGAIAYGTYWAGNRLFDSGGALDTAVSRVNEHSLAVEALGSPIEPKLWRENTTINFANDKMRARFGVTGPQGSGRVEVRGHKSDGEWVLDELLLHVDDRADPINLLEEETPRSFSPRP